MLGVNGNSLCPHLSHLQRAGQPAGRGAGESFPYWREPPALGAPGRSCLSKGVSESFLDRQQLRNCNCGFWFTLGPFCVFSLLMLEPYYSKSGKCKAFLRKARKHTKLTKRLWENKCLLLQANKCVVTCENSYRKLILSARAWETSYNIVCSPQKYPTRLCNRMQNVHATMFHKE